MDDALKNGLLPEGLRDGLPPKAGQRERVVRMLQDQFEANGYGLVAPPLVEFEAGLRGRLDAGQGDSSDAFHLLDPTSQKTLVVRSDITRQVARIATTRLADEPRPLRLAYTGSALRTRGTQLRPSRQVRQVGIELIGAEGVNPALELIQVVAMAFDGLGLTGLTYDLSFPGFIPSLCKSLDLDEAQSDQVCVALDDKDAAGLSGLPEQAESLFHAVLQAIGSPEQVVSEIAALGLPDAAAREWDRAAALTRALADVIGADRLNVDPGEVHGFSYQTGWALSVFGDGIRGELGKGGAYVLSGPQAGEMAQGFTFYPDVFADQVAGDAQPERICVAVDIAADDVLVLQSQGYVVVRALGDGSLKHQAKEMDCVAIFSGGQIKTINLAP